MRIFVALALILAVASASPINKPSVKTQETIILTPVEAVEAGPTLNRKARQFFGGPFGGGFGGSDINVDIVSGGFGGGYGGFGGPIGYGGFGGYDGFGGGYGGYGGGYGGYGGYGGLGGFGKYFY